MLNHDNTRYDKPLNIVVSFLLKKHYQEIL